MIRRGERAGGKDEGVRESCVHLEDHTGPVLWAQRSSMCQGASLGTQAEEVEVEVAGGWKRGRLRAKGQGRSCRFFSTFAVRVSQSL